MRSILRLIVMILGVVTPLVWAEPPRELRDCPTCPVLVEVPADAFERVDKLGGPAYPVRFERSYAIGKYAVTRSEAEGRAHTRRGQLR
jgi:hypothetical protein